jgi:hypothetical protein
MNKTLLLSAVILLGLASCTKKFIDIPPESSGSAANFYQTASDVNQAVAGAYQSLQSTNEYGQNFVYFMEVNSDNSKEESVTNSGGAYGDFDLLRVVSSNAALDQTWQGCYQGILRCNTILSRIGGISMDSATKSFRIGESEFIRALTYFNLVRIWGDVPLVTKELANPTEAFAFGRTGADSVYALVITDLQDAIIRLPVRVSGADIGRATRIAAGTLLGKVYLTQKNYTAAATQLKAVIDYANANPSLLALLPNYADIFKVTNKNNKESIFEIQFSKGGVGTGSAYVNLFSPANTSQFTNGIGTAVGDNEPSANLVQSYTTGDLRKAVSVGVLTDGRTYAAKYVGQDVPDQANDAGNDFVVLRYADVVLMYAEVLNETGYDASGTGYAWAGLNAVHQRAGLSALTTAGLPDQGSFRLALENERRWELAFENHRWFDLIRTGRMAVVMNASGFGGAAVQATQILAPVPISQINTNPAKIKDNATPY